MLFMFNFACEKIKIFNLLTYSICSCLNLGLFRKDYLGHVNVWLTGKWVFYFIQPIYPFWQSSFTEMYDIFQLNRMLWKHIQFSNIVDYSWYHFILLLMEQWPSGYKALHSQSRYSKFKSIGWLQDSLSRFHPSEVNNMTTKNCQEIAELPFW